MSATEESLGSRARATTRTPGAASATVRAVRPGPTRTRGSTGGPRRGRPCRRNRQTGVPLLFRTIYGFAGTVSHATPGPRPSRRSARHIRTGRPAVSATSPPMRRPAHFRGQFAAVIREGPMSRTGIATAMLCLGLAWVFAGCAERGRTVRDHRAPTADMTPSDSAAAPAATVRLEPGAPRTVQVVPVQGWTGPGGRAFYVAARTSERDMGHPREYGSITLRRRSARARWVSTPVPRAISASGWSWRTSASRMRTRISSRCTQSRPAPSARPAMRPRTSSCWRS